MPDLKEIWKEKAVFLEVKVLYSKGLNKCDLRRFLIKTDNTS